jgi:hypothetical protein
MWGADEDIEQIACGRSEGSAFTEHSALLHSHMEFAPITPRSSQLKVSESTADRSSKNVAGIISFLLIGEPDARFLLELAKKSDHLLFQECLSQMLELSFWLRMGQSPLIFPN